MVMSYILGYLERINIIIPRLRLFTSPDNLMSGKLEVSDTSGEASDATVEAVIPTDATFLHKL